MCGQQGQRHIWRRPGIDQDVVRGGGGGGGESEWGGGYC